MERKKYKALIVDDEKAARSALKESIGLHCPLVSVAAEAGTVKEAISLIDEELFDIIFLDIRLTDGLGFDVLKYLEDISQKVIFTTAYSEYAIDAFKFNACDYLLKPVSGEELTHAINKIVELEKTSFINATRNLLSQNIQTGESGKRIALHTAEGVSVCDVKSIIHCKSDGNYVHFYFTDRKPLMVTKSLRETESLLENCGFERVHHSHLINLEHMEAYLNKDGGYVKMDDGTLIPVSKRKRPHLLETLNIFEK